MFFKNKTVNNKISNFKLNNILDVMIHFNNIILTDLKSKLIPYFSTLYYVNNYFIMKLQYNIHHLSFSK